MTIGSFVVLGIVVLAAGLAARTLYKDKKAGKHLCGGDCGGCGACSHGSGACNGNCSSCGK